ncbi:MAG: hypothetical protein WBO10_07920 [Pyrinomonadaceae bacterium]
MPNQVSPNQASLFQYVPPADRWIKLRDVETELAGHFHHESRPSRNTIIGWCEDGTLVSTQIGRGRNYYIRESSLNRLIQTLTNAAMEMAA